MSDGLQLTLAALLATRQGAVHSTVSRGDGARSGPHATRQRGRGMEFSEARPYLPGDDVRSIDWRLTARTGRPHTKLFREERDRTCYLLLDLAPEMYFGSQGQLKARLATLLAARFSWQALQQGDKVGGLILLGEQAHYQAPAGRRQALLHWLTRLLAAYQAGLARPADCPTLAQGLGRLNPVLRPGSQIVVLSDFYRLNGPGLLWLRRLHRQHELRCVQIMDSLELRVQGSGRLAGDNGQQQGYLDGDDALFRRHYARVAGHRQQRLEQALRAASSDFQRHDAAHPLAHQGRTA